MKRIFIVLIFVFLFPIYAYPEDIGFLRSSLIEGDVQVNTEYITEWLPLSINVPIREKDKIWVPDGGRAELNTRDGTYIRLNENSSLEVISVERDFLRFYLPSGSLYINYKGKRDGMIQVDMDNITVVADSKAIFRIDANSIIRVSVYKGEVIVEDGNGKTFVSEGKSLSLREGHRPEMSSLGPVDEWERWNRDRDRVVSEKRYSYKYLPDELREYSYDFDNYGEWVYVSDYGYVWTPRVALHIGWAPYKNGRWVWIGGDFVWISYDPWGWVPHHYGRWVFIARFGWCWVPPKRGHVYWAPGYVAWVYTPTYVAWVPLAPYEIYYGYGYFGPYSINIINVDIRKIQIKKVYKNIYIKNAVTVVHKDNFLKGKHEKIKIDENPFLKYGPSIGRPDFKPEREAFMPIIKDIPHSKLPPPSLEKRLKEIKKDRPSYKGRIEKREIQRKEPIERFDERYKEPERPPKREPSFKEERQRDKGREKRIERHEKIIDIEKDRGLKDNDKGKPLEDRMPLRGKGKEKQNEKKEIDISDSKKDKPEEKEKKGMGKRREGLQDIQ